MPLTADKIIAAKEVVEQIRINVFFSACSRDYVGVDCYIQKEKNSEYELNFNLGFFTAKDEKLPKIIETPINLSASRKKIPINLPEYKFTLRVDNFEHYNSTENRLGFNEYLIDRIRNITYSLYYDDSSVATQLIQELKPKDENNRNRLSQLIWRIYFDPNSLNLGLDKLYAELTGEVVGSKWEKLETIPEFRSFYRVYRTIRFLLISGVNPDEQDNEGRTALHYAAMLQNDDIYFLVSRFALLFNIPDEDGKTPLYYAIKNTEIDKLMIDEYETDPFAFEKSYSPTARTRRYLEVARDLYSLGSTIIVTSDPNFDQQALIRELPNDYGEAPSEPHELFHASSPRYRCTHIWVCSQSPFIWNKPYTIHEFIARLCRENCLITVKKEDEDVDEKNDCDITCRP